MSQRRMFSPEIVGSEEFLSMPVSSQALYFHLGMNADDDGFIQPKKIMRSVSSTDDDLKVLLAKRFLLPFESGVVVIKHWLIHNMIRQDRYKPTRFQEEKSTLYIKKNKAYTDHSPLGLQNGNQMAPQVRLGKDRIDNKILSSADEKSLSSKDMKTYNENEHQQEVPTVNLDTGEIEGGKEEKKTGNIRFAKFITYWKAQCLKHKGIDAEAGGIKDKITFHRVEKKYTIPQMQEIMEYFLQSRKSNDHLTISACFSADTINNFKLKK